MNGIFIQSTVLSWNSSDPLRATSTMLAQNPNNGRECKTNGKKDEKRVGEQGYKINDTVGRKEEFYDKLTNRYYEYNKDGTKQFASPQPNSW